MQPNANEVAGDFRNANYAGELADYYRADGIAVGAMFDMAQLTEAEIGQFLYAALDDRAVLILHQYSGTVEIRLGRDDPGFDVGTINHPRHYHVTRSAIVEMVRDKEVELKVR